MVTKFYLDKRKARKREVKAALLQADDVGLCNCAQCEKELLGEKTAARLVAGEARTFARLPEEVAGRINGRPMCEGCLALRVDREGDYLIRNGSFGFFPGTDRSHRGKPGEDASAQQENNIRAMEDGQ
jgi:hypothetical protein